MSSTKQKQPSAAALKKAGADYARKEIAKVFKDSSVQDKTSEYPTFERSELTMGKLLGQGGFGVVYEIRSFHIAPKKPKKGEEDLEIEGEHKKEFIAQHCIRQGGDARYAVKYLKKEVIKDPALFIMAIKDMAIESRFLSSIRHPNIIKMRALATVDPYNEDFFIVMDRLYDTLEQRMEKWLKRKRGMKGIMGRGDKNGLKAQALMEERVGEAYDLSAAFEYLHEHNIVYRDIKPENIGFDVRGDIKIFDFGLAKELHKELANADGTYNLTGTTGSTRYMAPEVSEEKPYNASCDAYSFAILFWQMLSLEVPFANYLPRQIREQVHQGGKRPKIDPTWGKPIIDLLERCWSVDPTDRYNFKQVTEKLRAEMMRSGNDDVAGLDHQRRRSTFVFKTMSSSMDYDNSASSRNGIRNSRLSGEVDC